MQCSGGYVCGIDREETGLEMQRSGSVAAWPTSAAAAAASVFLCQREEILAARDIILFPWESRFSLSPPVNRGAYPESRGDFWGAIWG